MCWATAMLQWLRCTIGLCICAIYVKSLHWGLHVLQSALIYALMQGEEEVAAPEKPAMKQIREEDVFAGNKNLRSEDQKFREMHDDRHGCSCPCNPALAWPAKCGLRAQPTCG